MPFEREIARRNQSISEPALLAVSKATQHRYTMQLYFTGPLSTLWGGESRFQPLLSIQLVECIMCGVSSPDNDDHGRCMHEKESGVLHVEVTLAVWRVDTLFRTMPVVLSGCM
jgi:hypothetical protein